MLQEGQPTFQGWPSGSKRQGVKAFRRRSSGAHRAAFAARPRRGLSTIRYARRCSRSPHPKACLRRAIGPDFPPALSAAISAAEWGPAALSSQAGFGHRPDAREIGLVPLAGLQHVTPGSHLQRQGQLAGPPVEADRGVAWCDGPKVETLNRIFRPAVEQFQGGRDDRIQIAGSGRLLQGNAEALPGEDGDGTIEKRDLGADCGGRACEESQGQAGRRNESARRHVGLLSGTGFAAVEALPLLHRSMLARRNLWLGAEYSQR